MARAKWDMERSAVEGDFKYWGYYKGRQCAADGYPAGATIKEIMAGSVPRPGHRILVKDMTPRAWDINGRIMQLPSEQIEALIGRYCLPVKANGTRYEADEIATAIGVSVRTYHRRLTDARVQYRRILFPPCVAFKDRVYR